MEDTNEILARVYFNKLTKIDWNDEYEVLSEGEWINKIVGHLFLILKRKQGVPKYRGTHYVSEAAAAILKSTSKNSFKNSLVFEHMVPKNEYFVKPCVERAKNNTLTIEFIKDLLDRYLKLATITKEEDRRLAPTKMPKDWDGIDIFSRYNEAGIKLIPQ